MKIYLSADIEGVTGVDHWDEATKERPGYENGARQMTAEVSAACRGALKAGPSEFLIQDAHDSARNMDISTLPREASFLRGWSDDPRCMAQELDGSFDALILIGCHAPSGSGGNPLCHTFSPKNVWVKLNCEIASEALVLQYTAAYYGVPLILATGDEAACAGLRAVNPALETVAVKRGLGNSAISLHPGRAAELIEAAAERAAGGDLSRYRVTLPKHFSAEIRYQHQGRAYKTAFYPGMRKLDDFSVGYETDDFYEVLRMFLFAAY